MRGRWEINSLPYKWDMIHRVSSEMLRQRGVCVVQADNPTKRDQEASTAPFSFLNDLGQVTWPLWLAGSLTSSKSEPEAREMVRLLGALQRTWAGFLAPKQQSTTPLEIQFHGLWCFLLVCVVNRHKHGHRHKYITGCKNVTWNCIYRTKTLFKKKSCECHPDVLCENLPFHIMWNMCFIFHSTQWVKMFSIILCSAYFSIVNEMLWFLKMAWVKSTEWAEKVCHTEKY